MFHYLPWLFVGVFVVTVIIVLIKKFRNPSPGGGECIGDEGGDCYGDAGGTSLDDIDNRTDNRVYAALRNSDPRHCHDEDNYYGRRRRKKGKAKTKKRCSRRRMFF